MFFYFTESPSLPSTEMFLWCSYSQRYQLTGLFTLDWNLDKKVRLKALGNGFVICLLLKHNSVKCWFIFKKLKGIKFKECLIRLEEKLQSCERWVWLRWLSSNSILNIIFNLFTLTRYNNVEKSFSIMFKRWNYLTCFCSHIALI